MEDVLPASGSSAGQGLGATHRPAIRIADLSGRSMDRVTMNVSHSSAQPSLLAGNPAFGDMREPVLMSLNTVYYELMPCATNGRATPTLPKRFAAEREHVDQWIIGLTHAWDRLDSVITAATGNMLTGTSCVRREREPTAAAYHR
ncbi:hypothetical protein [Micromonospora musae]|nr:hypothetical protein [Micromonospora musae]